MTNKKPIYYDIPEYGIVMRYLLKCKLGRQYNIDKKPYTYNWWNYQSRRVFKKSGIPLNGGFVNHIRISKSKWIESLDISMFDKMARHKSMNHSYQTALQSYS